MQNGGELVEVGLRVVDLGEEFVELVVGRLQFVVGLELRLLRLLQDVLQQELQFARQLGVGGGQGALALQRGHCRGQPVSQLGNFAEHELLLYDP